jgi:hypothetical protein
MKNNLQQTSGGVSVKKRRGFNFIDVLLILFILAIVFVAVNIVYPTSIVKKLLPQKTHTIQYTVEFAGVDDDYIDAIRENDTVIDAVGKHTVGTVATVSYDPYTTLEYDGKTGVLATHENKYNVSVVISVDANYVQSEGYSASDVRIAVGEKMALRFPGYSAEGYCTALSVVS